MDKIIDRIVPAGAVNRRGADHANRMIVAPEDFAAISPFLVLVEDWFRAPAGFPTHPHRGIQTVTVVLDGALEHRDHTGGHGVLRQGDVQWMTAGHGVLHSELPHERETAHTLQLWLNLPARQKMIPARYVNQLGADVPVVKAARRRSTALCRQARRYRGAAWQRLADDADGYSRRRRRRRGA